MQACEREGLTNPKLGKGSDLGPKVIRRRLQNKTRLIVVKTALIDIRTVPSHAKLCILQANSAEANSVRSRGSDDTADASSYPKSPRPACRQVESCRTHHPPSGTGIVYQGDVAAHLRCRFQFGGNVHLQKNHL